MMLDKHGVGLLQALHRQDDLVPGSAFAEEHVLEIGAAECGLTGQAADRAREGR